MTRLRFIAPLLVVVATAAAAPAAAPRPRGVDEPAETRFVLFALEDMLGDTWPNAKTVGDARQVRAFIAQRERIVHDLSARANEAGLGGDHNKELIEKLELYVKSVRDRGEKHATQLDKFQEAINKRLLDIWIKVNREAAPKRLQAARQVTLTAIDYMSTPDADPLVGLFGTLALGMLAETAINIEVYNKGKKESDAYLQQAKRDYEPKALALAARLVDEMKKDLASRRKDAAALANTLAKEKKWKPEETPFTASSQRKGDVFTEVRRIAADPVATDKGETREAADRVKKAKAYMKAALLVPKAKHEAYIFFRALCYSKAGEEANKAATLTVGPHGFAARNSSESSRLALDAWRKFAAYNDRDVTGRALHQFVLALGYNGLAMEAYERLKANTKLAMATPEYYYAQARICSVASEQLAVWFARLTPQAQKLKKLETERKQKQMLEESSLSMERAACLGFKDFARAKEAADLKAFRAADAKLLGRRRTFEQIAGDR
jgi:hypothetical protein